MGSRKTDPNLLDSDTVLRTAASWMCLLLSD